MLYDDMNTGEEAAERNVPTCTIQKESITNTNERSQMPTNWKATAHLMMSEYLNFWNRPTAARVKGIAMKGRAIEHMFTCRGDSRS